jgi:murein DD-endopeptidase MepM/ murein hydrolase activator NlpD
MSNRIVRPLIVALAVLVAVPAITSAAWPVSTRSSYISQWYGSGHRGIDIAATKWSGVVPIGNGKVVFAGWKNNCGGYQVWVRHRDGVTHSAYYHLARETTSSGAYVTGETTRIGNVGATGCATGPHLHLEVWKGFPWRWGSTRVNPWNYVSKGYWLPYRYR